MDLDAARTFVLGHGRLLDRSRFDHLIDGGSAERVLGALRPYQNPDGGFGNALEPDIRASASQSQGAEVALRLIVGHELVAADIVEALLGWCASNAIDGVGLPFALPSVAEGPRAPWWQPTDTPDLNPTAAIVALSLRLGVSHPWIAIARDWCWTELVRTADALEVHQVLTALALIEADPDRADAEVVDRVRRCTLELAAIDVDAEGYVFPPLSFAPRPDSLAAGWFERPVLDAHLDALTARQADDGGWTIPWDPPVGAARNEWRAIATIDALTTLRAYRR